ncbi:MAG: glycosyltransferase family 4 protein [Tepidisphaeraceae bacterium]|jgi:glycosyltransferase involved in cell wall biosynthesis
MSNVTLRAASIQTAAVVGSYVPRQCGIATFSKDLRDAVAAEIGPRQASVIAIDDIADGYAYPDEVRFQIPQHKQSEYISAADLLNVNQIDCVLLQHEFGIYGGKDGSQILEFTRTLRMPIITTLHTILLKPSSSQRAVLKELAGLSDRVVVMSHLAEKMLHEVYGVPKEKIAYIPHGIPDVSFVDPNSLKERFGMEGRRVLLSFGLLSPGKGLEVAIRAMPQIVAKHPDVMYIILGATHPHVLKNDGNAYRNTLERLVDRLGLDNHVVFHNRFVTPDELQAYIGVTEIYITPYPNQQQITSGTLAYAVGAGKAVVSTPYWHAEEMLADGRGRLFPFGDVNELARHVNELLDDETEQLSIRRRAYQYGRPMVWKEVARSYLSLAATAIKDRSRRARPILGARAEATEVAAIPDVNLAHLKRLTDDTGILQHAIYAIPNRHHGYCTDDNCRALVCCLRHYELTHEDSALALADKYLSFIHHAFNPEQKRFRNFLSYDRRWLEDIGSEDVHGRTVWALGSAVMLAPNDAILSLSIRMLHEAFERLESFTSPRAWAFSLVGLHAYLTRFSGDTPARRIRQTLANRLMRQFKDNASLDWPWCEDTLTYDNAKLPHALILTAKESGHPEMLQHGLKSLEWLVNLQIMESGRVSLIGNRGWLSRDGKRARFDQQPVEAMAMTEACAEAYRVTKEEVWFDRARTFLDWFTGNNDTGASLYDYQTGGCRDGLQADGPNLNQGAESTLAWLIALLTMMDLHRSRAVLEEGSNGVAAPSNGNGHAVK